jgi:nucleolar complex protein 3
MMLMVLRLTLLCLISSKKETDRIHALQKSQNPLPKKRKAKEIELESDLDDEDLSDWDSEMDDEDSSGSDVGSGDESLLDDSAASDEDEEDEEDEDEDEDEQVNLRKRKNRGTDQDELEASYEAAAKKRAVKSSVAQAKQDATAEVGHLPIKLPGGEIQQVAGTTKIEVPVDPKLKKQQQQEDEETEYSESEDEGEVQAEEEREAMSRTKGRFGRMGIADILSKSFDDDTTTNGANGSKPKDKGKEKERARRRLDLAKEQIARTGAEVMAGGELIDNVSQG